MNNRGIANMLNLLGKIMELHGENPFKIRSYYNAYVAIRKLPYEVIEKTKEELIEIKGIGKAIAEKIIEIKDTGELKTLNQYLEKTPKGIVELLQVKGFGPKKIKSVWTDLGIESPGELLYACEENRLVELKGFGAKSQDALRLQLIYFLDSQGKYLYGHIIDEAIELLDLLKSQFAIHRFEFTRGIQRKMPIVEGIEILTTADVELVLDYVRSLEEVEIINDSVHYRGSKILLYSIDESEYNEHRFQHSGSESFINEWKSQFEFPDDGGTIDSFKQLGLAFIPSESRESIDIIESAKVSEDLGIIDYCDIKGVIHTHSTYSDGTNSIKEMAEACKSLGYEYLVMSDHSKAAFYANGLNEDRVLIQMDEIDQLNSMDPEFKIFKSIECDILYDGSLDYQDDFLKNFELVIASVHSNLRMDESKATERILRAVEHPSTRILGHMTGRLLLSREGYPLNHKKIIEACSQNNVVIELNANPYRLDIDWEWINYVREKGVMISINPDAHSISGIRDIRFGVDAARKAALRISECINTKDTTEFMAWLNN